jgi:isochorismate hydrolase
MNQWWRDPIYESDIRSNIIKSLESQKDTVIIKSKYSAFQNTPLDQILKQNQVKQIIICGVMTHLCCESTIRDAFMRNYPSFFVVDGTATYTEQLHLGSLRAVSHGFGKCVASEEIINGI